MQTVVAIPAQPDEDLVRALLKLPDQDDESSVRQVGDLIAEAIAARHPMPDVESVRRLLRANVAVLRYPTVKEWLAGWLPVRKRVKRNTFRSCESHVRPYLGTVRLDKLRIAHVADIRRR